VLQFSGLCYRPALLALLLIPSTLSAQQIAGHAIDPQNSPVAKTCITLAESPRTTCTAPDGAYRLDLPPGLYHLTATAPSFLPIQRNLTLLPNQVASLNLQFNDLAPQSESLRITGRTNEPAIEVNPHRIF
jgi:hypothetical protein